MTISDRFLWNFENVINFASPIYCPKIILKNCTHFKKKINLGSFISESFVFVIKN